MKTLNTVITALRESMKGYHNKAIAKACGVDVLAVRKVRNGVKIDTLKIGTLRKLIEGVKAMRGECDAD